MLPSIKIVNQHGWSLKVINNAIKCTARKLQYIYVLFYISLMVLLTSNSSLRKLHIISLEKAFLTFSVRVMHINGQEYLFEMII